MNEIKFDFEKLNKKDQQLYLIMTETERRAFEKNRVEEEALKLKDEKLRQQTKERHARDQKALSERMRKERTHRLIERGAILESLIDRPEDFTNDDIKMILEQLFSTGLANRLFENFRKKDEQENSISEESSFEVLLKSDDSQPL